VHLSFCTTFMTSDLAVAPEQSVVAPLIEQLPPPRKLSIFFAAGTFHQPVGDFANRRIFRSLPPKCSDISQCEPIIFNNIQGLFVYDAQPNNWGIAKNLVIQFWSKDSDRNPIPGELHLCCGKNGDIGGYSPTYKDHRVQVHTASLIAQLYNFMQRGDALQDISVKMTAKPLRQSTLTVLFDKQGIEIPYDYVPNHETRPEIFTHRVNKLADHLHVTRPFMTNVSESLTEVPIMPVLPNDSTTSNQEDD